VSLQPLPRADDAAAGASDSELLEAIAEGSDPAFEELRRRYRQKIERTCRTLLRPDQAEDCAQETFVRIWQKARLFDRERGSAASWLLTLTRNVAHNLAAKRMPEPRPLPDELSLGAEDAPPIVDAVWLDAALEELKAHERQVIELAYFADLSQAQIAASLGVPLGTVKSWTRRGLNRLATLLAEETGG
jgi:RNA polymerase sigma-70 factor (ECF subfamily)